MTLVIRLLTVRYHLCCRSSSLDMCDTAGFKLLVCPWPAKTLMPQVTVIISLGFLNNTTQKSRAFKILRQKDISPVSVFHRDFFFYL